MSLEKKFYGESASTLKWPIFTTVQFVLEKYAFLLRPVDIVNIICNYVIFFSLSMIIL